MQCGLKAWRRDVTPAITRRLAVTTQSADDGGGAGVTDA